MSAAHWRVASPGGLGAVTGFRAQGSGPAWSAEPVRASANGTPNGLLKVSSHCFEVMPDLSLARQFEHETQARAIDACTDLEELRALAKSLLKAWHMQAEMTQHYGAQALGVAPRG